MTYAERQAARHLAIRRAIDHGDDLDDYGLEEDEDDLDNPFASPSPPPESSGKKRKEPPSGLGIEEEVSVQKRVRVPNVKLDEERLLGPDGIPKLRKRAAGLKFKGKGHENLLAQFSDAPRLLFFYQLWLDDLFPKARFLDALAMVEKAGHKKALVTARDGWINEGRPKASNDDDDELGIGAVTINEDDDLYDATPRGARRFVNMLRDDAPAAAAAPAPATNDDMPDDDDLEALMAEAGGMDSRRLLFSTTNTAATTTAKQNTNAAVASANGPEDDDDDYLNALIAEAEAEAQDQQQPAKKTGNGSAPGDKGDDFADEEEAMREMDGLW
ncbi:hypothetical protein MKX08_003514 [Trichoderma sp. CBMAI-0020]|nr:hypothetical protein MKX08_003514 [Trichoderma sp. CBMAI-0020]